MAITTMSAPVQLAYDKKLLSVAVPNLIYSQFADKRTLPQNNSKTLRMERYNELATAPVPLGTSGVTPPGQALSSVFVDAEINFYSTYVEIHEQVVLTSQSPVLNQATLRLGESMRRTEDELIKNMLATTASSIFAEGGVNGDMPTEVTLADIRKVNRILMGKNAKKLSSVIEGQNKFGTAPVRAGYFGLASSDISEELAAVTGFSYTEQYPSQSNISLAEYGTAGGVRFLITSESSVKKNGSGAGKDKYNTFIVGMEAYATVKLDNYSSKFIYRDAMYSGPSALYRSAAWKMAHGSAILNDSWIVNLKSTKA